ncbi:MAG: hypothetical protein WCQ53_06265 [bacterium]
MIRTVKNKKGQVAVEFLIMFILAASLLFYIFYFAISLSALQYKQYVTFMVGRAITSSSKTYSLKGSRAGIIKSSFDITDSSKDMRAVSNPVCPLDDQGAVGSGFRGLLNYGFAPNYNVFSNAGIACSVDLSQVLPNILMGKAGKLTVAIESMTGSEMSDAHCRCLLDFNKTWNDCLTEGGAGDALIDNGC